jgi:hypothetical protein
LPPLGHFINATQLLNALSKLYTTLSGIYGNSVNPRKYLKALFHRPLDTTTLFVINILVMEAFLFLPKFSITQPP